ncbi:hypothetical protein GVX82_03350 [Patescibacteria group bacterium]|jgi:hypothetical protein|nr:hypothetical protein [Patescibacteria group bacterium]
MDWYVLVIMMHLAGTILGVGGATFIEINLTKALADGKVDRVEGGFLKSTFTVVRVGLLLTLISGALILVHAVAENNGSLLLGENLWAKITIIGILTVNALLLQAHLINLYWGSALSFVSWWGAAVIGTLSSRGVYADYWAIIAVYLAALVIGAWVLHQIRTLVTAHAQAAATESAHEQSPPDTAKDPPSDHSEHH